MSPQEIADYAARIAARKSGETTGKRGRQSATGPNRASAAKIVAAELRKIADVLQLENAKFANLSDSPSAKDKVSAAEIALNGTTQEIAELMQISASRVDTFCKGSAKLA